MYPDKRFEINNGKLYLITPASVQHQKIARNLTELLWSKLKWNQDQCSLFSAPTGLYLTQEDANNKSNNVEPDLFVICKNDRRICFRNEKIGIHTKWRVHEWKQRCGYMGKRREFVLVAFEWNFRMICKSLNNDLNNYCGRMWFWDELDRSESLVPRAVGSTYSAGSFCSRWKKYCLCW